MIRNIQLVENFLNNVLEVVLLHFICGFENVFFLSLFRKIRILQYHRFLFSVSYDWFLHLNFELT